MNKKPPRRIGAAERKRALKQLGVHLSANRIDLREFEKRHQRIVKATTQPEIFAEVADLPDLAPPADTAYRATLFAAAGAVATVAAIMFLVVVSRSDAESGTPPTAIGTTTPTTSSTATSATTSTNGTQRVRYLSDLAASSGGFPNLRTGPARVSGELYTQSVLITPLSPNSVFVEYDLGGNYLYLDAVLGVSDDATPSDVSMRFRIFADGTPIFESSLALGNTLPIHLELSKVLRLRLEVTNLKPGGDAKAVFGDLRAQVYPN
ncbi:DUF1707 domain-containing protein [Nocardia salmonicida]|uniref:DUF1707 domain-containing protein n=1 Tax=Nocardia salmonicida TaxID=53431 RepID=UPI0037AAF749